MRGNKNFTNSYSNIPDKEMLDIKENPRKKRIAADKAEGEDRYFQVLQNLPFAIYTCDALGYLTFYNDAAVNLWGREPELGKEMWCGSWKIFQMDGTPVPLDECPMAIVLKKGAYIPGEEFIVERPDGKRRFMVPYPQTEFNSSGEITGAINTLIDITSLKQAEFAARQNEQRFLNLVEKATAATAVLSGPEKFLTLANDAMLNIWDRDKSVIGKRLLDFMPELIDQPFPQLLNNVFTTGNTYIEEDALVVLKRKGELQNVYMDFSYTALRNNNNIVTDILVSAVDVTESVMFKKQLLESEKNFRNIIEQSPVAMCVVRGADYIVEIANERMYELWGKNHNEILHKPLFTGLPEIKGQGIDKFLEKVYTTGERFIASEFPAKLLHNGILEIKYVNFVYEALKESNGTISGIVVVAIDVTDQIKARQESEFLQQQKDDFIGIASHELKTPVTVIKAYTQILQKILSEKGEHKEAGMIGKMDAQINKLNSLIVDLLDTTKINSGKLQFNDTDFNFNELAKDVLDDIKYTIESHSIIQEFDDSCIVHADKERIGQVIDNFITNAIKYSPKANKIIIRTKLKSDEVQLSVEDFGIGINAEKKDNVFEQFYRVSDIGMQNTYPGIGLGLFIAAEIINRENGKIWVESVEYKGSTFCFSLPCKKI